MTAVAKCPQCEHELLIPDSADTTAWAKCPDCRAFFQLRDAASREISQLILLDDKSPPIEEISEAEAPTDVSLEVSSNSLFGDDTILETDLAEADTAVASTGPSVEEILARYQKDLDRFAAGLAGASKTPEDESSGDRPNLETPSAIDDEVPPVEQPKVTERGEFATKGIDKWFRSAETVRDIPALPVTDPTAVDETEFIPRKPARDETSTARDEIESTPINDVDKDFLESLEEEASKSDWSTPFTDEHSSAEASPLTDDSESVDMHDAEIGELAATPSAGDDGATIEFSADPPERMQADADFEIEAVEVNDDRPTWDDPDHMERLLADVEAPAREEWPDESEATGLEAQNVAGEATENDYAGDDDAEHPIPPIVAGFRSPRRRRSPVVLLGGTAIGGLLGLGIGYFALLWILGRDGDFLNVARFIPSAMLPASFQTSPAQFAADTNASTSNRSLLDGVETSTGSSPAAPDETAEMTASYDAPPPSSTANDDQLDLGDRYSTANTPAESRDSEPRDFEIDDAAPIANEVEVIAIAGAPSYTIDQLSVGLNEAKQAQPALVHGSLRDESVQRAKGLSFTKLSQLAELVTFADREGLSPEALSVKQQAAALFRETLAEPRVQNEVGYIASRWIDFRERRLGGVFLAGQVSNQSYSGQLVELEIDMGVGSPITVVAPTAAANDLGDSTHPIAVVGSIIDNPSQRISGYSGSAPRVIWAGALIPLE